MVVNTDKYLFDPVVDSRGDDDDDDDDDDDTYIHT